MERHALEGGRNKKRGRKAGAKVHGVLFLYCQEEASLTFGWAPFRPLAEVADAS
jgi:hypothetical protein